MIMTEFLYRLYYDNLPIYFNNYMLYLEARETQYNLRPHLLPVLRVTHAYPESCLLYKLVETGNDKQTCSFTKIII